MAMNRGNHAARDAAFAAAKRVEKLLVLSEHDDFLKNVFAQAQDVIQRSNMPNVAPTRCVVTSKPQ